MEKAMMHIDRPGRPRPLHWLLAALALFVMGQVLPVVALFY